MDGEMAIRIPKFDGRHKRGAFHGFIFIFLNLNPIIEPQYSDVSSILNFIEETSEYCMTNSI